MRHLCASCPQHMVPEIFWGDGKQCSGSGWIRRYILLDLGAELDPCSNDYRSLPVVGKVTVTPLKSYITSYFLE